MATQGADWAESGSQWAEFHENLAYRMFNLVRKSNFGSKGNSGSEFFVFFSDILVHIKNHENFKTVFWSRESEKPIFTIFLEIFTRKIRDTEISSETTIPEISSETTATQKPAVGAA